ncbi:MAG: 5'/3'-nucleotidase SurE [Candidatus Hydrogenedentota bacterium]
MTSSLILVTNDDGFLSPALVVLAQAMEVLGEVWVYAPDMEKSAVGHGISLNRPLRVQKARDRFFHIDGTPADCVLLAVNELLPRKPDLVMSGINPGPNLGDDVTYSGTVAGAYEGMLLGIPSIAISNASYEADEFEDIAQVGVVLGRHVLEHGLPPDTVLNVNVPQLPLDELNGFAITRQGIRDYGGDIHVREDPRGKPYYWIGGFRPDHIIHDGTDFEAISENKVSVTPLHRDITNHESLGILKERNIQL